MLPGQKGEPVAYNLRSNSKITVLPAVTSANRSEPMAKTAKPVGDPQKAEVKSQLGDMKVWHSLSSV